LPQGIDLGQLVFDGGPIAQASLQTHNRLTAEAAPIALGGSRQMRVQAIGQVFQRERFGHALSLKRLQAFWHRFGAGTVRVIMLHNVVQAMGGDLGACRS
jgi:hypothetical protein